MAHFLLLLFSQSAQWGGENPLSGSRRENELIIKITFPYSLKKTLDLTNQLLALPTLPDYIIKKGPYTNNAVDEAQRSLVVFFEFDDSKCAEACRSIFRQMEDFYIIPGFTFSTQILGETKEAMRSIGLA
jgi:hypothetical protein